MEILAWLAVGLIAGWLAAQLLAPNPRAVVISQPSDSDLPPAKPLSE